MDNIIEPNSSFDFSSLSLAHPTGIQGGSYFTRIHYNNKPLYIQTCQSLTKQGFVKSGKKYYCDLMFDKDADVMINWFETLEETCQKLIYEKADTWFQNALEMSDVESAFTPIIRVYRSGKYYLVRTNIKNNSSTNEPILKIYDENEIPQSMKDVDPETKIISILEIQGIKFTTRNFQIEIEMKQAMIIHDEPIFENCLIKTSKLQLQTQPQPQQFQSQQQKEQEPEHEEERDTKRNIINININESTLSMNSDKTMEQENIDENENIEDTDLETVNHLELLDELDLMDNQDNQDNQDNTEYCEKEKQREMSEREEDIGRQIEVNNTITTNTENLDLPIDIPVEVLDMEDIEEIDELKELDFGLDPNTGNNLEKLTLKKPNEVYFDLYKQARNKAKEAKKAALIAYLEAKKIKKTYMLESLNDDEESDFDDEIEDVSESELDGL